MHWRIAMGLGLISAAASMASATEVIRRAPVQVEAVGREFQHGAYGAVQGSSAFAGTTGCCASQPSCCDNVWAGYCGSRKSWCNRSSCGKSGCGKSTCQKSTCQKSTCGKSTCGKSAWQTPFRHHQASCHGCGVAQKGGKHWQRGTTQEGFHGKGFHSKGFHSKGACSKGSCGKGRGGCGYAFGLVAPAPCGASCRDCGHAKGGKSHHAFGHRVSGWKHSLQRSHGAHCGCSSCGNHWRQTYAPGAYHGYGKGGYHESGSDVHHGSVIEQPQSEQPSPALAPTATGSDNELAPVETLNHSAVKFRFGAVR